MAYYKYNGETFHVDGVGDCQIKVSDDEYFVSISPRPGSGGYTISTAGGRARFGGNSVEDAVRNACQELIEDRTRPSQDELCKAMAEFVENLDMNV